MKKLLAGFLFALLLTVTGLLGACAPEVQPAVSPAAVTDLEIRKPNLYSVELAWTSPGDTNGAYAPWYYDVRYAEAPLTEESWERYAQADVTIFPNAAGTQEVLQVNALETGKSYCFAVRAVGTDGAVSGISNLVTATTGSPGVPDEVTVYSMEELQAAVDSAPATGRVITVAKGTYQQEERVMIENKDNITIQGETDDPKDTVLIGRGINDEGQYMNMKVISSTYITVKNLTLRDSYYHAIQIAFSAHYFRAENLICWDNGESGFKINALSDYGVIENCHIGFTTHGMREVIEGIDGIGARGWLRPRECD